MKLSKEKKLAIKNEYESFVKEQYGEVSKEERNKLGAVFTPPEITIAMIEKFKNLNGTILDPCCGAGNLLAGCIMAGADPNNIYGNEYTDEFKEIARERLQKLGVPTWHIHRGNALQKMCITYFDKDYDSKYKTEYIDDLDYAQDSFGKEEQISLW